MLNISFEDSFKIKKMTMNYQSLLKKIFFCNFILLAMYVILIFGISTQYEPTHNFLKSNVQILILLFIPILFFLIGTSRAFIEHKNVFKSVENCGNICEQKILFMCFYVVIYMQFYCCLSSAILFIDNNFSNIKYMYICSLLSQFLAIVCIGLSLDALLKTRQIKLTNTKVNSFISSSSVSSSFLSLSDSSATNSVMIQPLLPK